MTIAPLTIRRLVADALDFDQALTALTTFEAVRDARVAETVAEVIAAVRRRGDAALLEYTQRFDRLPVTDIANLRLGSEELEHAVAELAPAQRAALAAAAARIRRFHEQQRQPSWSFVDDTGTRLGQRTTAIDRVGLYVPGGKAAYPSTVLMNAIPAQVAGVTSLVMVVPTPEGVRNRLVLAAARFAGIDEVWTVGGAQAVAALAYGTESIGAVDKIVGPGNAWVAEAKRQVYGEVGIDMIAGPSEVVIVADGSVPVDWVAMDLFAQAEHDELAQSILISPDAAYLDQVARALPRLLASQPRRAIIARSLSDRGALIQVADLERAAALVNRIAPEHLELAVAEPSGLLERIRHAGAIFCGSLSSESLGDYCAGPSHVLPTMRTPRFASPLGVYDFQKRSSVIEVSAAGALALAPIAATLARAESFEAHARSAELRTEQLPGGSAELSGQPERGAQGGASASAALAGTAAAAADAAVADSAAAVADVLVADAAAAVAAKVVRDEVRAMSAYHVEPAAGLIKLDAMENPFRLPPELASALGRRLADVALNRYPIPDYALLKQQLARQFGVPPQAGLVLGNGSDELIQMLCALVAGPQAVIASAQPSFVMYTISAAQYGLRHVGVSLRPDFSLDREAMIATIKAEQPALVFLAWPNNPTGNAFDRDDVAAIIRCAPGLVVIDEAYEPFAQESWIAALDRYPNLAVLRTLSKWGLAGVRLGFLAAAPAWTEQLEKLRPPYNISVLNEAAARFALDHGDVFATQAAAIRAERARLSAGLQQLSAATGSALAQVYPSAANFVVVRIAGADGAGAAVARRLRAAGVLIKDVGKMHPLLANCLRLTVGTPEENQLLLQALAQATAVGAALG